MHFHCRFYLVTGSDSHLHCWFYLKTNCDSNFPCRFYLKTDSDVHAPLYKINCQSHTSISPTHEFSQSHFSRFTLTSQDIHSLSTWFGHGSCIFQWYWYVVFSNILYIFIWSYVATFYLEDFFVHIFYVHIFFAFYRSGGMNNGPPHHKNQVSTLAMSHSLLMWPFHGSLFQLLYEIFFNIFYFYANK